MMNSYSWYSHSGSLTTDNWDYCGVKTCENYKVFIVVDGTTNSFNGGELAQKLIKYLISEFPAATQIPPKTTLIEWLRQIHRKNRLEFLGGSASYVLAILGPEGQLITLHAGDCLLGKVVDDREIQWLLSPHTMANATNSLKIEELVKYPDRNKLTRSFRGRAFLAPEYNSVTISLTEKIILASDGFWADLSKENQLKLICGRFQPKDNLDDISFLLLSNEAKCNRNLIDSTENIFIQGF